MAGKINNMINTYIKDMSAGDPNIIKSLNIRLSLNGIIPANYSHDSEDDPIIIEKIQLLAEEANIML